MDCARFDRRLDALLEGSCSAVEWQEAEAHAAACARCRLLLDAMAGFGGSQDAAEAASLADAVLARTSGAPCGAARERLGDLVDGELEGIDRELVEGHLARCRACAELAAAMARASQLLPSFAALQPPADLAPAVIAATSRRPPAPTFDERVSVWLSRLAARPRFSLEAAYVCTLLVFVLVGNPVAAFRETSARGRELAQPRVEQVLERVAAGPAGLIREIGGAIARRAETPQGEAGVASRAAALLSPAWEWVSTRVFAPLRDAFEGLMDWVWELGRPNPSASGRVTETGGAKAGTDGGGGRR